jgi:hypothetical protein
MRAEVAAYLVDEFGREGCQSGSLLLRYAGDRLLIMAVWDG